MACCCGQDESGRQKHKPRTPEQVKSLVTRLNRIDGQILGIKKMIEENRYCPDVLMQVSAVQSSLNSFRSCSRRISKPASSMTSGRGRRKRWTSSASC